MKMPVYDSSRLRQFFFLTVLHTSVCVCVFVCVFVHMCVHVRRAAAYSKLGNYAGAVQDCERAISIDPNYSKAYGRMG